MTTNTTTSTTMPTSQPADGDQPTLEGVPTTPARTTMRVVKRSGEVDMDVNDVLEPDDIAEGLILACQAIPKTDSVEVTYDE